ncbi:MAG: hypothetical protein L6R42_003325 [Xanthoria sp. 1 TBL-2021]|nr:MAG: hypothetical protein L6R42_003325 [Xanthoria sp. 1 TBL-2021]
MTPVTSYYKRPLPTTLLLALLYVQKKIFTIPPHSQPLPNSPPLTSTMQTKHKSKKPPKKEKQHIKAIHHPTYEVNSSGVPYKMDYWENKAPNLDNYPPNPAQYKAAQKLVVLYRDKSANSMEERLDAVEAARVVIREYPEVKKGVKDDRGEGCDVEQQQQARHGKLNSVLENVCEMWYRTGIE